MITIIHGPMASGKTFHKQAFAKKFECTHIVDGWNPQTDEVPSDRRLLLTTAEPHEIRDAIRMDRPSAQVRVIDIKTARSLIGVAHYASGRTQRASL
jgi:hypothetical protein